MDCSLNYFINKFENIPEEKWLMHTLHNNLKTKFCALGHCGMSSGEGDVEPNPWTPEAIALNNLFVSSLNTPVSVVNDNEHWRYQQLTPRQRILAALYDIKAQQALAEVKEIISQPSQLQTA